MPSTNIPIDQMIQKIVTLFIFPAATLAPAAMALEVPNIFSDHMVLQQDIELPIWGTADPGTAISVEFADQEINTTADSNGKWILHLDPVEAGGDPQILIIESGENRLEFADVVVGEVWLASGQSNMEWSLNRTLDGDMNSIRPADDSIRFYDVSNTTSQEPRFTDEAKWQISGPDSSPSFSAVAYHFARDLQEILEVPVGIIHASWGGTPAIAWTREQVFDKHPLLSEKQAEWEQRLGNYPEAYAAWETEVDQWRKANDQPDNLNAWQIRRQGGPRAPRGPNSPHRPASLANGMLAPVAPYAIRGAIWYQGEADAGWAPEQYDERLGLMIEDWRDWWNLPEMAFGIVQLANFLDPKAEPSNDPWPNLRESQRRLAAEDDLTGLVVTIDVGELNDIHPRDKFTVGRRLARWALADVYHLLDLRGGPELQGAEVAEGSVLLTFSEVGSGLTQIDSRSVKGFTLAGADGVFYPADAKIIDETTLQVSSPEVIAPTHVRYAWQNNPVDANLGNKERLPASPFEVKFE